MGSLSHNDFLWITLFLTSVDDHSWAVWIYLLPDKSNVSQHIKDFLAMVETQFSKKIKTICSDNKT